MDLDGKLFLEVMQRENYHFIHSVKSACVQMDIVAFPISLSLPG